MAPDFLGKCCDACSSIRAQALIKQIDPPRWRTTGVGDAPFHEAAQACAQMLLGYAATTLLRQRACQRCDWSPFASLDRRARIAHAAEPSRIEFDLDLLESFGRHVVTVSRSGAIEDHRRTGNGDLAELSVVRIAADHE
jgi:hypothetical protein